MDFSEERNMILDMVAEGRITVDDAKELLDALESSKRKKETEDDFFVTPGMDFHIPEVRVPNVSKIVNRAVRRSMPGYVVHGGDFEDIRENLDEMRENLEEEIEHLKEQMDILKEESKNIAEEIKEQAREQAHEHHRRTEEWEN